MNATTPVHDDHFLFDQEKMQRIAGEQELRLGLADFKDHRVLEVNRDDEILWAEVEDENDQLLPMRPRITRLPSGALSFSCDCREDGGTVCRHLVAALVLRGISLAQSRSVPPSMLAELAMDVADFVQTAT